MNELSTKSLAQIVTENPGATAVFEKYQIDFCCKGKRTLYDACREKLVPVDAVLEELEAGAKKKGTDAPPMEELSLSQLSDYIVHHHHAYVKREAAQLIAWLQQVTAKHGSHHPELLKIRELFASVKEELELHMQKEEGVLFPRIKELEKFAREEPGQFRLHITYIQSPINMMEQEHEHAGSLLEEIRRLSHNYELPGDACTTYRLTFGSLRDFEADLHRHVHLENNILFPKAIGLFRSISEMQLN